MDVRRKREILAAYERAALVAALASRGFYVLDANVDVRLDDVSPAEGPPTDLPDIDKPTPPAASAG